MEYVGEPSKELERDNSLAVEVTTEPVNQVMELMEDEVHFVPPSTGGLTTTATP